MMGKDRQ